MKELTFQVGGAIAAPSVRQDQEGYQTMAAMSARLAASVRLWRKIGKRAHDRANNRVRCRNLTVCRTVTQREPTISTVRNVFGQRCAEFEKD